MGSELGIVLAVPHLTGRQRHRANTGPENPDPEVYCKINLAILIPGSHGTRTLTLGFILTVWLVVTYYTNINH